MQATFALSEDQVLVRDAAEKFLAEASSSAAVRAAMLTESGFDGKVWSRIAQEMGWCGIHIPEAYGGLGLSWAELTVLLEQMGRRLLCSPFFATVVLAATALIESASEDARARHLPGIAAGQLTATVGFGERGIEWDPTVVTGIAYPEDGGFRLEGSYRHVADAATADLLLLTARLGEDIALFAVPRGIAGIRTQEHLSIDRTRRVGSVQVSAVALPLEALIARGTDAIDGLARTSALATIGLASEQLGGAQQCLDLTLAYTATRIQFGRTINSFQAVKHRCAEMMVKIEAARSALAGALHVTCNQPSTPLLCLEAASAKVFASEAYDFCAAEAIQLHGGVGFSWEYDPHLYFKRAQMSGHWLGEPVAMCQLAARALLDDTSVPPLHTIGAEGNESFRSEIRQWMGEHLSGRFACLRHRGGPGDEDAYPELRKEWERELARGRWTCVGWPARFGGRSLSTAQQIIFHEEYARAGGPGRMGHLGEALLGPTLIAYGTEDQKRCYLPGILAGTQYWAQGYSEPNAGSDLSNVQTRARWDEDAQQWMVEGQKVWTSLAHESQFIFIIARCEPGSKGHQGLVFLLMRLDQPGVQVRPIRQITGTCEFNEVFFVGARCSAADVVGAPGEGWKIAMALLGFERGLSWIGMQQHFEHQLHLVCKAARETGADCNSHLRSRIGRAWIGLKVMHYNTLRTLAEGDDGRLTREAYITKYYWSNWHRDLGKLAMDVLGLEGDILIDDFSRTRLQQVFLFSRSDTIVAGTNEIQLNIIAERALGMPKEPRRDAMSGRGAS